MKKKEYIMPLIEVESIDSETILEVSGETEEQYAKGGSTWDDDFDDEDDNSSYTLNDK